MIRRLRPIGLAAAIGAGLPALGCRTVETVPATPAAPPARTAPTATAAPAAVGGLQITLATDTRCVQLGDTVTLRITLHNVGDTPLRCDAGSGVFGNDFENGRWLWRRDAAGRSARARRLDGT